jgi:hypothetical protein
MKNHLLTRAQLLRASFAAAALAAAGCNQSKKKQVAVIPKGRAHVCLLYTSPSPRDV